MSAKGLKQPKSSAIVPPRTLNVQKFADSRASELEALHSIVSDRLNGDFRSQRNKRRRTTGYDNRVAKRRFRKRQKINGVDGSKEDSSLEEGLKKKLPRYVRRRVELGKNPESGFLNSGDGTKRLRTHIWHAKRFTMTKLWSFHLPLGLHGRGRGSRSIMKCLHDGVIVHDASYSGAVQLEGPEERLLSVLSTVLVPSPSTHSEGSSHHILSGVAYGRAMLHHCGVSFSHAIAPVTYIWRPSHKQLVHCDEEGHSNDVCHNIQENYNSSAFRLVWIWIHAAAFKEGYDALETACQRENEKTGALVTCISLEGQLGKLDVMGSKASQLLQKIIHPLTGRPEKTWELMECSVSEADNESIFENEDQISSSVFTLNVKDPRVKGPGARSVDLAGNIENEVNGCKISASIQESSIGLLSSQCFRSKDSSGTFEPMYLWDASRGILPPVEESVLCMEKHHQKLASYFLDVKGSGNPYASTKMLCSRVCPILLLRNNNPRNSIMRWSIILPLSWVKAFWIPLVSSGGQAIGLREKHWISCELGLPYFPSDFPGCNAYSSYMATEAASCAQNVELHTLSVRPLSVPSPPPWDIIWYSFNKESPKVVDTQSCPGILSSEDMIKDNLRTNSPGDCHVAPCCSDSVLFEGLVPRTSHLLSKFLKSINGNRLLLFPKMPDRSICISKIMKDKETFSQDPNMAVNYNHKLCFIRVLLSACKKGVFEEGAIVCAPHLSDLASWTCRSDDEKVELQIPQTLLRSYFVQKPSGKWDVQVPDDPVARESHRWPIGFVTTGFVRGSKKPVAGALCDAVLLASLREEQWNAVPVKQRRKEIYVLVRNLRSTSYRLALANIVLEQQEDDLEYM